jgi:hypothetical protein
MGECGAADFGIIRVGVTWMVAITGHFDGKVIVPDEPIDLPRGQRLLVHIEPAPKAQSETIQPGSAKGQIEISDDFEAPLADMSEYRE